MPKGNHEPRTEKQLEAARKSKGGGRPATGKTPQTLISFPADWADRVTAILPPGTPRNRWIMEHLEAAIQECEGMSSSNLLEM